MNMSAFFFMVYLSLTLVISPAAFASGEHHDDEAEHAHSEAAKGPHGGRLLTQDDLALEVTIYETEVEPEFRLYLYKNGEPVKTTALKLQVR